MKRNPKYPPRPQESHPVLEPQPLPEAQREQGLIKTPRLHHHQHNRCLMCDTVIVQQLVLSCFIVLSVLLSGAGKIVLLLEVVFLSGIRLIVFCPWCDLSGPVVFHWIHLLTPTILSPVYLVIVVVYWWWSVRSCSIVIQIWQHTFAYRYSRFGASTRIHGNCTRCVCVYTPPGLVLVSSLCCTVGFWLLLAVCSAVSQSLPVCVQLVVVCWWLCSLLSVGPLFLWQRFPQLAGHPTPGVPIARRSN